MFANWPLSLLTPGNCMMRRVLQQAYMGSVVAGTLPSHSGAIERWPTGQGVAPHIIYTLKSGQICQLLKSAVHA